MSRLLGGGLLPPGVSGDGLAPGGLAVQGRLHLNGAPYVDPTAFLDDSLAIGDGLGHRLFYALGASGSISFYVQAGDASWSMVDSSGLVQLLALALNQDGSVDLAGSNAVFSRDLTGSLSNGQIAWNAAGDVAVANQNVPTNGGIGTTRLKLTPTVATGAPISGAHEQGEMLMDAVGSLFVCTAAGTPGTWKRVSVV